MSVGMRDQQGDEVPTRNALVVGANGGIGRAIAWALGTAGARLTLAARDEAALSSLAAELEAGGISCRVRSTDVSDAASVAELVAFAAGAEGLDIAVNNVGISHPPTPLHQLDLGDADRVLQVSLRGVLVAMKYELGAMNDSGSLVNVVSTAGLNGAPGMSAYVAAKHGVVGLTRTAAIDYAARGIRVNAVAPGPIESGGLSRLPAAVRERIGEFTPLRRIGRPEEVADAVAWLASPLASYTTGSVLTVDGGKGAQGA